MTEITAEAVANHLAEWGDYEYLQEMKTRSYAEGNVVYFQTWLGEHHFHAIVLPGEYVEAAKAAPTDPQCRMCGHVEPAPIQEPPMYSVVSDCDGDTWQRRRGGWHLATEDLSENRDGGVSWDSLDLDFGPLTIIHFVPEEV
jgi:hypothetical protein